MLKRVLKVSLALIGIFIALVTAFCLWSWFSSHQIGCGPYHTTLFVENGPMVSMLECVKEDEQCYCYDGIKEPDFSGCTGKSGVYAREPETQLTFWSDANLAF